MMDCIGELALLIILPKVMKAIANTPFVNKDLPIAKKLRPSSAAVSKIYIAAVSNDLQKLKNLLSSGANVNMMYEFGRTPLHLAALESKNDSHFEVIETLLKNGADPNLETFHDQNTPLHILIWNANIKSVELLIKFKADIHKRDQNKEPPFYTAVHKKNVDILKLLVDHGADIKKYKSMALVKACRYRDNARVIKYLLTQGADIFRYNYGSEETTFEKMLKVSVKYSSILLFALKYSYIDVINKDNEHLFYEEIRPRNWKIILQHVAKLKAVGLEPHWSVLEKIFNSEEFKVYFKQCEYELMLAKGTKLKNSWITYFDLLVGSKRNLKNFAGNEDLVRDFKNSDCLNKFPVYGEQMQKNMEKGIKRRKLFDRSSIALSYFIPVFNPNHLVLRDIHDCMSTKDLLKLCS